MADTGCRLQLSLQNGSRGPVAPRRVHALGDGSSDRGKREERPAHGERRLRRLHQLFVDPRRRVLVTIRLTFQRFALRPGSFQFAAGPLTAEALCRDALCRDGTCARRQGLRFRRVGHETINP